MKKGKAAPLKAKAKGTQKTFGEIFGKKSAKKSKKY